VSIGNFDGAKARAVRQLNGWTCAEVGEAIGVSRQTVYNWESGATRPAITDARDLAFALRVEESALTTDGRRFGVSTPVDEYIRKLVESAPPLTAAQRSKLAALLNVP
jgi:DNA-binding XRE family transcriptional regulator